MSKELTRKVKGEYVKAKKTSSKGLRPSKCIADGIKRSPNAMKRLDIFGVGCRFIAIKNYNLILKEGYNNSNIIEADIIVNFNVKKSNKNIHNIVGYTILKYNGIISVNEDKKSYNFTIGLKPSGLSKVIDSMLTYKVNKFTIKNNILNVHASTIIKKKSEKEIALYPFLKH